MKSKNAKIEKMLFFYSCFLFKLENATNHPDLLKYISPEERELKMKNNQWYLNFVYTMNYALDKLDKQERELIDSVYVKGIPKEELPYSTATFYNTKNRAFEKLQYLLLDFDIETIAKELDD